MKVLLIVFCIVFIVVAVASAVVSIVSLVSTCQDKEIENEILAYLKSDTEDEGNYVILLQPCTSSILSDHPEARAYYAWMTDADGDTTMKIVRYKPGEIEAFTIWWEQ